MKIPVFVLSSIVAVIVAIQAWTLSEIVNLKVNVATLSERIAQQQKFASTKTP